MELQQRRSRQEWEQIVEELEASGLSAREFAHRRGLRHKTLTWWRWELRREEPLSTGPAPSSFLPVAVEGWSPVPTPVAAPVEAALPNGVTLRFEYALDAAGLRDLAVAFGAP